MAAVRDSPFAFRLISRMKKASSGNATPFPVNHGHCAMQDSPASSQHSVLIVEPDRDCAAKFAEHLRANGYTVATTTPDEMLSALQSFDASIVLCDIEGKGAA